MAQPVPPADDANARLFTEGTVVLAYHGTLLYEAIVKVIHTTPSLQYTVRYQGWTNSWDAQVPASHVLVHNDINLEHAHALLRSAKARQQAIVPVNTDYPRTGTIEVSHGHGYNQIRSYEERYMNEEPCPNQPQDPGESIADPNVTNVNGNGSLTNGTSDGYMPGVLARPRTVEHEDALKRSRPTPTMQEPQSSPSGEDNSGGGGTAEKEEEGAQSDGDNRSNLFHLPTSLKAQLVDDFEFISKESRLVPLPREFTVEDILDKWVLSRESLEDDTATLEVADAVKIYFDSALPTMLLYRFERLQYNTVFHYKSKDKKKDENNDEDNDNNDNMDEEPDEGPRRPVHFYGAEHLVRLLCKMPFMLDKCKMEEGMMEQIAERINDLCRFIVDNGRTIFLRTYKKAPKSYIENVKNGVNQPPPDSLNNLNDPALEGATGNTNGGDATPSDDDATMGTPNGAEMIPENMSPLASNMSPAAPNMSPVVSSPLVSSPLALNLSPFGSNSSPLVPNSSPAERSTPGSSDRGVANGIPQSAH